MERPHAMWRNPADLTPPRPALIDPGDHAVRPALDPWTPYQPAHLHDPPSPVSFSLPQMPGVPGLLPLRRQYAAVPPVAASLPPLEAPPFPVPGAVLDPVPAVTPDRYAGRPILPGAREPDDIEDPEIEYHSQAEGMSDTDDAFDESPARRMPMANFMISDDDLAAAKRSLLEAGYDADRAHDSANITREIGVGLVEEMDRLDEAAALRDRVADLWQQALRDVREARAADGGSGDAGLRCEQALADVVRDITAQRDSSNEIREALNAKLAVVQTIGHEIFKEGPAPTCPICWARGICMIAQPCGHTYCDSCCEKMLAGRGRKCFTCKGRCRGSMRIHLP